jgi:hypothetical protein
MAVGWEIASRTRCHNTLRGKQEWCTWNRSVSPSFRAYDRENSEFYRVRDSATPLRDIRNILRPFMLPKSLETSWRRRNINNHRIMNVKSSLTFDSMLIPFSLRILVLLARSSFQPRSLLAKKSKHKTNDFLIVIQLLYTVSFSSSHKGVFHRLLFHAAF